MSITTRFARSPNRLPPARARRRGAVHLAPRAGGQRAIPAADRGHRSRAVPPRLSRCDHAGPRLARPHSGRPRARPVPAPGRVPVRAGPPRAARPVPPLLLHQCGHRARGRRRGGWGRPRCLHGSTSTGLFETTREAKTFSCWGSSASADHLHLLRQFCLHLLSQDMVDPGLVMIAAAP